MPDFLRRFADFDERGYLSERRESAKEPPAGSGLGLRDIFLRGQIARGEVERIINVSPRTAQTVTGKLMNEGLLRSDSPIAAVRLDFSADAAANYFQNLFPTQI